MLDATRVPPQKQICYLCLCSDLVGGEDIYHHPSGQLAASAMFDQGSTFFFNASDRKDIFPYHTRYGGALEVMAKPQYPIITATCRFCVCGNKTAWGAVLVVGEKDKLARFEQAILPHLDAAYNLARWLTRNEQDAQDMVQEAYLRAFKFFDAFRGMDGRAWLLTIVRNTCYTWLHQNRAHEMTTTFDEEIHSVDSDTSNPATLALQSADHQILRQALDELPVEFREVVVLRDLEGFSYKEIAGITNIPTGTVMSRLARARARLKKILCGGAKEKL